MELAGTLDPKSKQYRCNVCDYTTSRLNDYNKHLLTVRHNLANTSHKLATTRNQVATNCDSGDFVCVCGTFYKSRSGLWKHRKTCFQKEPIYATNEQKQKLFSDEMVLELIKQNKELQMFLIEHTKIYQINNTMTNSNNTNNTFNLQVFLNETCKNAMNLTDFVNSLNVTINDLEETGRIGYSDGITNIIVKGLKDLDVCERPIHCSDVKRETIYVKEEDVWQKDENHDKLTKAIKQISYKNTKNITEWQKLNPEYNDPKSKQSSRFNKLLLNVMSGGTITEQQDNITKIVKNITREVVIQKNYMSLV